MMNLKEIGTKNYNGKEFVFLESMKEEKFGLVYSYWVTIRDYDIIEGLFGLLENRKSVNDLWEYMKRYDLADLYIRKWDGIEED